MSYLNKVIRRTSPLTRCQCAVAAVLSDEWSDTDTIWKRNPVYAANSRGVVKRVAYGTVSAILRSLVQQGFAEVKRVGKKGKFYRSKIS